MDTQAVQALGRFGLGGRGAEPVPTDPAGWLAAQLQGPDPARIASAPSTARGLTALLEDRQRRRTAKLAGATLAVTPAALPPAAPPAGRATAAMATAADKPGTQAPQQPMSASRAVFESDARAE